MFLAAMMAAPGTAVADRGDYPALCESERVLSDIVRRFGWAERRTWHRGFEIDEIISPRLRYQVTRGPTSIWHDHCTARAVMTDGTTRKIYYTVERGMGFASIGNYVRFCIVGLDPWRVYGAYCSTVR
jgi:hypothetical protein